MFAVIKVRRIFVSQLNAKAMTIKDYMTANKQEVIDTISDEVRYTKTNVKEASLILVTMDAFFQKELKSAKPSAYFSAEYVAFKMVMEKVVVSLVISKISDNDADWAHIEASTRLQMASAFN